MKCFVVASYLVLTMLFSFSGVLGQDAAKIDPAQVNFVSLRLLGTPFELVRPAAWVEGPVQGKAVMASWIHPQAQLYPNLNVTREKLKTQGRRGVEDLMAQLRGSLPGFKANEGLWIKMNGIEGYRSVAFWDSIFGRLGAVRFLIPWQDDAIVITFVDHSDVFETNLPIFNKCISGLINVDDEKKSNDN